MNTVGLTAAAVFTASLGLLAFNGFYDWDRPYPVVQVLAGGVVFGLMTCALIGFATGKR